MMSVVSPAVSVCAADQAEKEEAHELEQIGVRATRIGEPVSSSYAVSESSELPKYSTGAPGLPFTARTFSMITTRPVT